MKYVDIGNDSSKWRLFIDYSKRSLLQNGSTFTLLTLKQKKTIMKLI